MDLEIRPEPSPEEREAIIAALEGDLARDDLPAPYRSAWRDQGIRESLGDEDGEL